MLENSTTCELVNTYEVLEHIMGINGLHPHSLSSIELLFENISNHATGKKGVILDVGCGSGSGTYKLSRMLPPDVSVIGIDINRQAIKTARSRYSEIGNIDFYPGTLEQFCDDHPDSDIIGVISVSVSMFIPNTARFYQTVYDVLCDGGIFVDAPFVFNAASGSVDEIFKRKTYSACGCNMTMHTTKDLGDLMQSAAFENITMKEDQFDLINPKSLFKDYPPSYLIMRLVRNISSPPEPLHGNSSWYLFKRTLGILGFFLKYRGKFGAAVLTGFK